MSGTLRSRVERALDVVAATMERLHMIGLVERLARPLLVADALRPQPAIVVLCGGCRASGTLNDATCARVEHGVDLWRRGLAPSLVLSGGRRTPYRPSCAPRMQALAEQLGVDARHIVVEDRSARTTENAREVAQLLRARAISSLLLVTSAVHMRRAKLCFEHEGLEVSCAPVPPRVHDARFVRDVFHEYLGLAYYRVQRWI